MLPIKIDKQANSLEQSIQIDFPSSKLFCIASLITLALTYAKLSVHFYVKWQIIVSPLIVFFIIKFLESVWQVRQSSQPTKAMINIDQLKIKTIWSLSQMLICGSLGVGTLYLADLLQKEIEYRDIHQQGHQQNETSTQHIEHDIQEPLQHLFFIIAFSLIVYLGYSYTVDSIMQESQKEDQNTLGSQLVVNFLFSTLGNSVAVCSGGACNSFYISTLSAFFSAFGISISHYIHYLNFLCVILLFFSLLSLYSVKNSWKYGPFISTFIGAVMVFWDLFIHDLDVLSYVGNIIIIASAFWNNKLNKFSFLRRNKNKT